MSRPTARVLALLEILQNGGTRTVDDLAERLGVDERTVRRYVAHLLELDIPVESVRGRYGGYRLAPGYRLPPLMLTDDEAVAVLVGLVTGPGSDAGASRLAAESAAAKVRRVLPKPLSARLGALLDVAHFPGRSHPGPPPEVDVLLVVAEAARTRRTVEIVHSSRNGRTTERTVQPYGIVAHAGHWYMTGLDAASGEARTFRLDRVSMARLGSVSFEVPAGFQPQDAVLDALARTPWHYTVSVKVHASKDAVQSRLPAGVATLTPLTDEEGWTRVEIRAEQLDWVPGVLAALDADLVVEGPDELRDRLRALAQRLLTACGDAADKTTPADPNKLPAARSAHADVACKAPEPARPLPPTESA
jgi:predicted DNA-binding transcriptional regulator YafY